ncbi:cytochrome P450 2W1-like [Columba livia]|uniref:cytochrome P450 2W1-like n=1 Tax=Columba livia TaxID=8932 RepID=UPI0031BA3747
MNPWQNKPVALGSKTQQPDGLRSLDIAEETGLNHQNLRVTKKLVAEGALEDDTKATMWDLGMEKHPGEERMLEELPFFTELIKPFRDGPFPLLFLNTALTNIILAVLFGRRFHYEDPTFLSLLRLIDEVTHLLGSLFLHFFNFYPFLGFLLKPHTTI